VTGATRSFWRAGSGPRLVSGRIRHLAVLRAEWQRSMRGELRVALILGDAGLGKTRLATELMPREDEFAVGLTANSSLFAGVPSLGPWADALGLTLDPDPDSICRVCGSGLAGLPALRRRADTVHDAASCAETLRYHFVEWIPRLLAEASDRQPIVMVLEDVHRGHDAIWEMVLRLGRDCPTGRLFVVATARQHELATHPRAVEVLHALEEDGRVRKVALAAFSRREIRELSADALRRDHVPAELLDWLTTHARGNPRITVGLLEALAACDADPSAPALSRIPESLAEWIRTGLSQLDPRALTLLELLAVVGDDRVDPNDLARIAEMAIERVARALERLVRVGLVVEQQCEGSLCYVLTCALTREVLYTGMGGVKRRVIHLRVAQTLQESGRVPPAASHYVCAAQAGDSQAISALIEMIRRAQQRGMEAQAWQITRQLHDLLPVGDRRWCEVFDAFFQRPSWGIVDRTVHYVADIDEVRRMRQPLAGMADLRCHAEVQLGLADLLAYGAGDIDGGEKECLQAMALCEQAGRHSAARLAAIELAKIRGQAGDLRCEEAAARALLGEAERTGDHHGVAEARAALGHALGWQGRFREADDVLSRSVDAAQQQDRSSWLSQSLALLAELDTCRGHLVSARARYARAAECSPSDCPMIGRCGTFIELIAGDLVMAGAHAQHAQRNEAATSTPVQLAGWAAMVAAERGAPSEARQHLDALRRVESRALGILEPLSWWADGVAARAEGRFDAAVAALTRAIDGYAAMGGHALGAFVHADLAGVVARHVFTAASPPFTDLVIR
jgi:tetratricopeptide (TPR) repeat protein